MKIADFIRVRAHLTNEEILLEAMEIAYDRGWNDRDGQDVIDMFPADEKVRDEWLKSLK